MDIVHLAAPCRNVPVTFTLDRKMPPFQFPDVLFWLIFAGVIGFFLFNIVRRGGFKPALFNARISDTLGEVEASAPKLTSQNVKVHTLDRDGQTLVGIEVTSKGIGSWEMLPLVLSQEQASELSQLLQQAARRK